MKLSGAELKELARLVQAQPPRSAENPSSYAALVEQRRARLAKLRG